VFGLNKNDLKLISNKLDNQSKYLDTNFFTTNSGQVKSLREVSFSANHSERYYAQLSNKIDTMTKTAISKGLHSCFLTMTLDGYFRDLLRGDYTRFNSLDDHDLKVALQSVPNSEALGEVRQKIEARKTLEIKDLYNILNHQTKRFLQSYAFKKLKKLDQNYMYIRTVEPHKDGVPHFHMMLYIPFEHIEQFKKDFVRSYPAPQNKKLLKGSESDLISFQTDINDTTAYVMKYILKTFMNVKEKKEVDYIQAWYIKHRIMRCVTSRSLIPQWIYQICYAFEDDWYHLTDLLNDIKNQMEWSHEDNYFYLHDSQTDREIIYRYGVLEVVYGERVIKSIGITKERTEKKIIHENVPNVWTDNKKLVVPIYSNDFLIGHYSNNNIFMLKDSRSPEHKSDLELMNYYNALDYSVTNIQHIQYIKNCLIDRGVLQEQRSNLNDFSKYVDC